jgi:hypothetical protein
MSVPVCISMVQHFPTKPVRDTRYVSNLLLYSRSQNCEERLLASSCLYVCTQEQLGSYWTDFNEILYLSIFRKCVEKIQLSLESDRNNGNFTWIPSKKNWPRNVSDKCCGENQNTHFMNNIFSPENHAVYEIMWKNIVQQTGHVWQHDACAFRSVYLRLPKHTLRVCNTYCFSARTVNL